MIFCKDCEHYQIDESVFTGLDTCSHPSLPDRRDAVRGDLLPKFCDSARSSMGPCGPDAKLFEAKRG